MILDDYQQSNNIFTYEFAAILIDPLGVQAENVRMQGERMVGSKC